MIANPAQITRHHLANQAAPAHSLIRKVCACGKASTAKQLAQHGKCAACALAAVREAIMPGDFAKLQHMLGAVEQYPKCKWGWRNYFAAGSGQQHEAMQRLAAAGLATTGRAADEMTYFHATRLGCKAAGLDAAGVKRDGGNMNNRFSAAAELQPLSQMCQGGTMNLTFWLRVNPCPSTLEGTNFGLIWRAKNFVVNHTLFYEGDVGCNSSNRVSPMNRESRLESSSRINRIDYGNRMTFVGRIVLKRHAFNSSNKKKILA